MGTVIGSGQTWTAATTGTRASAAANARARAVLDELDARYEPAWWLDQIRRNGVVIAAVALGVIAVAGVTAALVARR